MHVGHRVISILTIGFEWLASHLPSCLLHTQVFGLGVPPVVRRPSSLLCGKTTKHSRQIGPAAFVQSCGRAGQRKRETGQLLVEKGLFTGCWANSGGLAPRATGKGSQPNPGFDSSPLRDGFPTPSFVLCHSLNPPQKKNSM